MKKEIQETLKKLSVVFFVLFFFMNFQSKAQLITIGTNTLACTTNGPYYFFYRSHRSEYIFKASELTAAGATMGLSPNSVAFFITTGVIPAGYTVPNWSIKMAWTTQPSLVAAYTGPAPTTVYGPVNFIAANIINNAWNTYNMTSFLNSWNGTDNLYVSVCNDLMLPTYGNTITCTGTATSVVNARLNYNDVTQQCQLAPNLTSTTRPNIQLNFGSLSNCTGTPVAPSISTSTSLTCNGTPFTINCTNAGSYASTGYIFQWQSDAGCTNIWTNVAGQNALTSGTFSQTTQTCYRLQIVCSATGGTSISNVISVVASACPTPTNISVSNITSTKATINWSGNNCAVKYRIRIRELGTTSWTTLAINAPTTFKLITPLQPLTTYEYQVRTDCDASATLVSSYSAIQTFTTLCTCVSPINISSSNISQTAATLNWTGNNCAVKYRLQYRLLGTTTWTLAIINAPTIFYNLTGLTNNSTYEYRMRSDCDATGTINSGWTSIAALTTPLRMEQTSDFQSHNLFVSPNPCRVCEVTGIDNPNEIFITDIVGRTIVASFEKSDNGFYVNLPETCGGIFIIRNFRTGEVVKFIKE